MSENFLSTLNKSQQEAAKHIDGSLLILAGAGSGKTKTITTRITSYNVCYTKLLRQHFQGHCVFLQLSHKVGKK